MNRLRQIFDRAKLRAVRAWLFVALLALLCTILAVLQYRWIGEISVAERERMKTGLDTGLQRLARDFNSDISSSINAMLPRSEDMDDEFETSVEEAYAARHTEWRESTRHPALFRAIGIATREPTGESDYTLKLFDPDKKTYAPAPWPANWTQAREALARRQQNSGGRPGPPGFGPGFGPPAWNTATGSVLMVPRFVRPEPDAPPAQRRPRDLDWLLAELNLDYLRATLLPELVDRHLGIGQYEAEVSTRGDRAGFLFGTEAAPRIGTASDGSIGLLDLAPDLIAGRFGQRPPRRGDGLRDERGRGKKGPPRGNLLMAADPQRGRWTLAVRNKAGSLDQIIARARWRNLGISLALLALVVATAAALIRFSRQAERLAQLQMDFVAGISHELRTPITVIRMAAFNLKGKIAQNPPQVERYGTLIQQESERLTAIVEQVLRFASIESGKATHQQEPVSIDDLIAHSVEACRSVIEHARCQVEQQVEPGLPLVLGDSVALQHALQNLITNAIKYGTETSNWIGVAAAAVTAEKGPAIEIRVTDRGPGIPAEEQPHLFDPFFRGRRAMQDQIHGTGLGLNLVKKIVVAHGGTIAVRSAPQKGTEFVIRIPVAPAEYQDEFAHSFG